jgi:hypothetical protein
LDGFQRGVGKDGKKTVDKKSAKMGKISEV